MSLIKTYPFTTAGNYTYDSDLIEVTGGVARLKQRTFANESCFNDFHVGTDLYRYSGTAAPVSTAGTPTVTDEKLVLNSGDGIVYSGDNFSNGQIFSFESTAIPLYSGSGTGINLLYCEYTDASLNNVFYIYQEFTFLKFILYSSTGSIIFNKSVAFSATSGVGSHISANIDITNGDSKFFVDGSLVATDSSTGARSTPSKFSLGATNTGATSADDFEIDYIRRFDSVYRAGAFTPSVDDYTDYTTSSPAIYSDSVNADGMDGYTSLPTGGQVKHVINVDGVDKYWDGSTWSTSSNSTESNTAAEIETNKASLDLSSGAAIYPKWYLTSTDGYTREELDSVTLTYNFSNTPETLTKCLVNGEFYKLDGTADTTAKLTISHDSFWYGEAYISGAEYELTADSNGLIEKSLVETASVSVKVNFKLETGTGDEKIKVEREVTIPNQAEKTISDLMQGV
jgi:hypothetical protein